jgi:REP element-mobilizing transposase RayT
VLLYCLAVAAEKTGVKIHAFCAMSNHMHAVLTDPEARLPQFMQWLDSTVARALNASHGRFESFWAPGSYGAVRIESAETILDKIVYTLANPVASGLVKWAHQWPGLWSAAREIAGRPRETLRPLLFFDQDGALPATASLVISPPPGFEHMLPRDLSSLIDTALEQRQRDIQRQIEADGRCWLGRKAVLAQKPTEAPQTREPRFQRNPRIAEKTKWPRIDAIARLREFRRAYREAWLRFKNGVGRVVFPAGTYLLRVQLGVPVANSA